MKIFFADDTNRKQDLSIHFSESTINLRFTQACLHTVYAKEEPVPYGNTSFLASKQQ